MRNKRRSRAAILNLTGLVIVNTHLGHGLVLYLSLAVAWCYIGGTKYAWRKTRICPVEIMARTPVCSWPCVFRRMYKGRATEMQIIYFTMAVLMVLKALYLLSSLLTWFTLFPR